MCTATSSPARKGHQDPHLRPTAHGQRAEKGHGIPGLRQSEAGEQAGRYGLLFLIKSGGVRAGGDGVDIRMPGRGCLGANGGDTLRRSR